MDFIEKENDPFVKAAKATAILMLGLYIIPVMVGHLAGTYYDSIISYFQNKPSSANVSSYGSQTNPIARTNEKNSKLETKLK